MSKNHDLIRGIYSNWFLPFRFSMGQSEQGLPHKEGRYAINLGVTH